MINKIKKTYVLALLFSFTVVRLEVSVRVFPAVMYTNGFKPVKQTTEIISKARLSCESGEDTRVESRNQKTAGGN